MHFSLSRGGFLITRKFLLFVVEWKKKKDDEKKEKKKKRRKIDAWSEVMINNCRYNNTKNTHSLSLW